MRGRIANAGRLRVLVVAGWLAIPAIVQPAEAQRLRQERLVTRDGIRLDYPRDGVWRTRARLVAAARAQLRSPRPPGRFMRSMQGAPSGAPPAMTGTLSVPTILIGFQGSDTLPLPDAVDYDAALFGAAPPAGRPYTMRTFYEEMSRDDFTVDGDAYGWVPVATTLDSIVSPCPNDGGLCALGFSRMGVAFRDALSQVDGSVDFGSYDNDGPDNTPNSGDDDGVVDVVQFVQPAIGAECFGPGIWAHKFSLSGAGGSYTTDDVRSGGGLITINAYHIVSGVGGANCQQATEIMPLGTAAHELGHGLGLPDLYDTVADDTDNSAGIGEWGLMASGTFTSLTSPAHFSAWSKEQMGWIDVREITANGTYSFGSIVSSDTAFLIRPTVANPRGEYFLFENKQAVGSDTANMQTGGQGGPKVGGLLIWHIDSTQIAIRGFPFDNRVNTGTIHGVSLIQADGGEDLEVNANRGDAGDPYPGSSANMALSWETTPLAAMNSDGSFPGFQIGSVTQLVPGGEMSLDVTFGYPIKVTINGSGTVSVNPSIDIQNGEMVDPGSLVTLVAQPDPGFLLDGWAGDTVTTEATLVLTVQHSYLLDVWFAGPLAFAQALPGPGVMGAPYSYALVATGGIGQYAFEVSSGTLPGGLSLSQSGMISGVPNESGDFSLQVRALSGNQVVETQITFSITTPQVALDDVIRQLVGTGAVLSPDELRYLDLLGNANSTFDAGDFLAWIDATGGSAAAIAQLNAVLSANAPAVAQEIHGGTR